MTCRRLVPANAPKTKPVTALTAAGLVRLQHREAQPVPVTPAAILARQPRRSPRVPDHGGADGADGHPSRYQLHAGGQVEGSEERRVGGLCPQGRGDGGQQRLARLRGAAAVAR